MRSLLLLLCCAAACCGLRTPDSGYLLPLPRLLRAGSDDHCRHAFNLFNFPGPKRRLRLQFHEHDTPPPATGHPPETNDFRLFSTVRDVAADKPPTTIDCLSIPVPANVTAKSARAVLELEDGSGVVFKEEHPVDLAPYSFISLVATDMARYLPGERVYFQLVTLGHDLRPVSPGLTHLVPEVWVTNPAGIRVAQWRNTPTTAGTMNLNLLLAEDTPTGVWTIHIKTEHILLKKTFKVEEFVPRVFNLDVRAPKRYSFGQRTLTIDVCARYLFEKPVIAANVTVKTSFETRGLSPFKTTHALTNSSGCATVDMIISDGDFHHSGRLVRVNVNVSDPASGKIASHDLTIGQDRNAARLTLQQTTHNIQPMLPILLRYLAHRRDGSPAVNETVQICTNEEHYDPKRTAQTLLTESPLVDYSVLLSPEAQSKLSPSVKEELDAIPLLWQEEGKRPKRSQDCREVRTDEEGQTVVQFPPVTEKTHRINVRATMTDASASDSIFVLSSPSHSYLSVDMSQLPAELPCNGDVHLHLLTTMPDSVPPVQMQVMARGRVVTSDVSEGSPLKLTLRMRPEMSPEIKLLVYTQLDSGEVVSDSRVLRVQRCLPNKVEVRWESATGQPGEQRSLTVKAAPNSHCSVMVADASAELDGTDHQITEDKVMESVDRLVTPSPSVDDNRYCIGLQAKLFNILKRAGISDASLQPLLKGFDKDIEDGHETTTWFTSYHFDSRHVFKSAGFLAFANKGVDQRPCVKRERPVFRGRRRRSPALVRAGHGTSPPRVRPIAYVQSPPRPDGIRLEPRVVTRDRVLHRSFTNTGEDGEHHTALILPRKPTSWIASAVCVHPQHGLGISNKAKIAVSKLLLTTLTLPYSVKRDEVINMSAAVFNHYDSNLSVHLTLVTSSGYRLSDPALPSGVDLCIAAGRSEAVHLPLKLLMLGEVRVTVTVQAKNGNCAQPNTVSPSDIVAKPVLVKPEGFPQEDTTSHFVCLDPGVTRSVEVELPRPDGLIPGSERSYVSVFGDMLGPSMLHLNSELSAPSGGGEPNLLEFVPNIHIHDYLLATGLMTESLRQKTENNMLSGYQRQLRYRRAGGSFSAYGDKDEEGSLLLTAFTIKSFKEAARFVTIDMESVEQSAAWVLRQQQTDGCFHPVGELLHTDIMGGVEREHTGALTAYVMLALHDVIGDYRLADGLHCMNYYVTQPSANLYTRIVVAHIYIQLGLEAKGRQLVDALLKEATREGDRLLYWRGGRDSVYGGRTDADLEMTSYMTLSLLKLSGMEYMQTAAKAVNWIISKRDSFFKSPQAAVVSLQALSAFSRRTFSSDAQSRVSVAVGETAPFWVGVNATNRLLLQRYKAKDLQLPSRVKFTVDEGCVTLQTSLQYSSSLQVPHPAFSLSVASTERPSRYPGSSYELRACAAYIGDADQSDRVVVTVEMPSGYTVVSSSLYNLRENGVVKSYKIMKDSVEFTVLSVTHQEKCLTFRILREAEVEELKPSVVTVHDYYEPEQRARLEYTI